MPSRRPPTRPTSATFEIVREGVRFAPQPELDRALTALDTIEPRLEELEATDAAAHRVLRAYGFFSWGHDAWCHDQPSIGCVTTAEALDLLLQDDGLIQERKSQ